MSSSLPAVVTSRFRSLAAGLASGAVLAALAPLASAQEAPGAQWGETTPGGGISVRAQIDVMYQPPDGGPAVLMQNAFQTGAEGQNLSSEYVFDILNRAVLAGVDQALAKGAKEGRISVVAMCYAYGLSDQGVHSLTPMGVFINTTDMDVVDGKAALHTNVKYVPPVGRQTGPAPALPTPAPGE